jgi:HK97 family phage portal protein
MIAEAAASIPWLITEGGREMEEHPLHTLLTQPNRMQGGAELWDAFYSFFQLAGNTYLEAVVLRESEIHELYVLRPDRMRVVPGLRGHPAAYEYTVGGNKYTYDVDVERDKQMPIMHMKLFNPLNDYYGMSPVEAAAFAVDIHNAAGGFNKALLDNVARPSGALGTDKELTEEQFGRLKNELENKHTGRQNAGKPLLLEGGLKWQAMSMTPQDLDFVEGKREAAREVALGFGVPPMLLGIPGDNSYANYAEANRAFYRQAVLPLVDRVCDRLTSFFQPTYKGVKVGYDPDGIEALAPERKELWDRLRFSEDLTLDEKRVAKGYEKLGPEKGGDMILVRSQFTSLDLIEEIGQSQIDANNKPDPAASGQETPPPEVVRAVGKPK